MQDNDVIWGADRPHWVALSQWSPHAAAPVAAPAATPEPAARPRPVADATTRVVAARAEPVEEVTRVVAIRNEPTTEVDTFAEDVTVVRAVRPAADLWHYALDGRSLGPFSREALIVELRRVPVTEGVSLWTKGMREWAPLAEFHDVLNELGVNRRASPRATISGTVTLEFDGLTQPAPLISISEGGVRLLCDSQFRAGEILTLNVKGEGLVRPFTARGEVRYCANGVIGLKFENLDAAARGVIATYVNDQGQRESHAA